MSTLTKLALGAMGQLRPRPAKGDARPVIKLPAPDKRGGLPLMQVLAKRRSTREFARKPLELPVLSSLLWAAFGVNRRDGGRTAPSAINAQEIDVYVALPDGAYLYTPGHTRCGSLQEATCAASRAIRTSWTMPRSISFTSWITRA